MTTPKKRKLKKDCVPPCHWKPGVSPNKGQCMYKRYFPPDQIGIKPCGSPRDTYKYSEYDPKSTVKPFTGLVATSLESAGPGPGESYNWFETPGLRVRLNPNGPSSYEQPSFSIKQRQKPTRPGRRPLPEERDELEAPVTDAAKAVPVPPTQADEESRKMADRLAKQMDELRANIAREKARQEEAMKAANEELLRRARQAEQELEKELNAKRARFNQQQEQRRRAAQEQANAARQEALQRAEEFRRQLETERARAAAAARQRQEQEQARMVALILAYLAMVSQYQEERQRAAEELEQLRQQADAAAVAVAVSGEQVQGSQELLNQINANIQDAQNNILDLQQQQAQLEAARNQLQEQLAVAEQERENVVQDIEAINVASQQVSAVLAASVEEDEKKEQDLRQSQQEYQDALQLATAEESDLNNRIQAMRDQFNESQEALEKQRSEQQSLQEQIQRMIIEREALSTDISSLSLRKNELAEQARVVSERIEKLDKDYVESKARNEQQLQEAQKRIDEVEAATSPAVVDEEKIEEKQAQITTQSINRAIDLSKDSLAEFYRQRHNAVIELIKMKKSIDDDQKQVEALEVAIAKGTSVSSMQTDQITILTRAIADKRVEFESAKSNLVGVEKDMLDQALEFERLLNEKTKLEVLNARRDIDVTNLENEVNNLKQALVAKEQLEEKNKRLQEDLNQLQRVMADLQGIEPSISSIEQRPNPAVADAIVGDLSRVIGQAKRFAKQVPYLQDKISLLSTQLGYLSNAYHEQVKSFAEKELQARQEGEREAYNQYIQEINQQYTLSNKAIQRLMQELDASEAEYQQYRDKVLRLVVKREEQYEKAWEKIKQLEHKHQLVAKSIRQVEDNKLKALGQLEMSRKRMSRLEQDLRASHKQRAKEQKQHKQNVEALASYSAKRIKMLEDLLRILLLQGEQSIVDAEQARNMYVDRLESIQAGDKLQLLFDNLADPRFQDGLMEHLRELLRERNYNFAKYYANGTAEPLITIMKEEDQFAQPQQLLLPDKGKELLMLDYIPQEKAAVVEFVDEMPALEPEPSYVSSYLPSSVASSIAPQESVSPSLIELPEQVALVSSPPPVPVLPSFVPGIAQVASLPSNLVDSKLFQAFAQAVGDTEATKLFLLLGISTNEQANDLWTFVRMYGVKQAYNLIIQSNIRNIQDAKALFTIARLIGPEAAYTLLNKIEVANSTEAGMMLLNLISLVGAYIAELDEAMQKAAPVAIQESFVDLPEEEKSALAISASVAEAVADANQNVQNLIQNNVSEGNPQSASQVEREAERQVAQNEQVQDAIAVALDLNVLSNQGRELIDLLEDFDINDAESHDLQAYANAVEQNKPQSSVANLIQSTATRALYLTGAVAALPVLGVASAAYATQAVSTATLAVAATTGGVIGNLGTRLYNSTKATLGKVATSSKTSIENAANVLSSRFQKGAANGLQQNLQQSESRAAIHVNQINEDIADQAANQLVPAQIQQIAEQKEEQKEEPIVAQPARGTRKGRAVFKVTYIPRPELTYDQCKERVKNARDQSVTQYYFDEEKQMCFERTGFDESVVYIVDDDGYGEWAFQNPDLEYKRRLRDYGQAVAQELVRNYVEDAVQRGIEDDEYLESLFKFSREEGEQEGEEEEKIQEEVPIMQQVPLLASKEETEEELIAASAPPLPAPLVIEEELEPERSETEEEQLIVASAPLPAPLPAAKAKTFKASARGREQPCDDFELDEKDRTLVNRMDSKDRYEPNDRMNSKYFAYLRDCLSLDTEQAKFEAKANQKLYQTAHPPMKTRTSNILGFGSSSPRSTSSSPKGSSKGSSLSSPKQGVMTRAQRLREVRKKK